MIYSPKAQPEMNESRVHELPKNNRGYFKLGRGFRTVT